MAALRRRVVECVVYIDPPTLGIPEAHLNSSLIMSFYSRQATKQTSALGHSKSLNKVQVRTFDKWIYPTRTASTRVVEGHRWLISMHWQTGIASPSIVFFFVTTASSLSQIMLNMAPKLVIWEVWVVVLIPPILGSILHTKPTVVLLQWIV